MHGSEEDLYNYPEDAENNEENIMHNDGIGSLAQAPTPTARLRATH